MIQIKLAKAAMRRMPGTIVTVSERAAFRMMENGLAVKDKDFMDVFSGKPKKEKPETPKRGKGKKK